jgi:hypothetical protein
VLLCSPRQNIHQRQVKLCFLKSNYEHCRKATTDYFSVNFLECRWSWINNIIIDLTNQFACAEIITIVQALTLAESVRSYSFVFLEAKCLLTIFFRVLNCCLDLKQSYDA